VRTVYGRVVDSLGHAGRPQLEQGAGRPELRYSSWAHPASEFRSVQPPKIAVDWAHDRNQLGEVIHLERSSRGLWAVAHLRHWVQPVVAVKVGTEVRSVDTPLFWSAMCNSTLDGRDIELLSIGLTPSPAQIVTEPVRFLDGDLNYRRELPSGWRVSGYERELLERAAVACADRRRGEPIIVHNLDPHWRTPAVETLSSRSRVEVRSAVAVDVSRSRRELDLIVAPAESPTAIRDRSGTYVETFAHGCFAGCENNPGKVKVNRDHERTRTVGKMLKLNPWDEPGLTGTAKLSRTALADEALALIEDDVLAVSAGFAISPGGDEWKGSSQRRVRRAVLDHVALVPSAAYEAATVTAMRSDRLLAGVRP
jgi:HK97 family phage prohead protease